MTRHANRRDENEPEVVQYLEACGYSVRRIHVPCDLLVGRRGRTHLVEVKIQGAAKRAGDGLTEVQADFRSKWRGCFHIAHTGEEAKRVVEACGG